MIIRTISKQHIHGAMKRRNRPQLTADDRLSILSSIILNIRGLMPQECASCVPLLRAKEETLWLAKLAKSLHEATEDGSTGSIWAAITKPRSATITTERFTGGQRCSKHQEAEGKIVFLRYQAFAKSSSNQAAELDSFASSRSADESESAGFYLEARDLIFTTPWGRPISADYLAKHFRSIINLAGVPRLRLYDLRHSAATIALQPECRPKLNSLDFDRPSHGRRLHSLTDAAP
jgi:hypothetical protein